MAAVCGCSAGSADEVELLLTADGQGAFGVSLNAGVADCTEVFLPGYADPPGGRTRTSPASPSFAPWRTERTPCKV